MLTGRLPLKTILSFSASVLIIQKIPILTNASENDFVWTRCKDYKVRCSLHKKRCDDQYVHSARFEINNEFELITATIIIREEQILIWIQWVKATSVEVGVCIEDTIA